MESFEHVTKIWLQARGFVVSSGIKFPVGIQTHKKTHAETQMHGYEVDLVGARVNKLVLVNVKSYFGSKGLNAAGLQKEKMFANEKIFEGILEGAEKLFGYSRSQMEIYVVAGRFASGREPEVRAWLNGLSTARRLPMSLFSVADVADGLLAAAGRKTYIDDPVIATVKSLRAAGLVYERSV